MPGPGGGGNGENGDSGDGGGSPPIYNNTTDPTNGGARFLGSGACRACHPDKDEIQSLHGHANILKVVQGQAPAYPVEADRAGVPDPPEGFDWSQIAFVIGGHTRAARFIDQDGFLLTNDSAGVDTQRNLDFPPNGNQAGFVAYEDEGRFGPDDPKPFGYDCFVCHTTGAEPPDPDDPEFQDNRPGIAGTWNEAGVQCEACHGPGSNHVGQPQARDLYVNRTARFCGRCHNHEFDIDTTVIRAVDGYIRANSQYAELAHSGAHAAFACVDCHEPHTSPNYDRERSHVRECVDCHANQSMALHANRVFVRGEYVEPLGCQSCHMPLATVSGSPGEVPADSAARVGDTRTHIFRIQSGEQDYTTMFNDDLTTVRTDDRGRAAVTVDYVCLRCHDGQGSAFLLTVRSAGIISEGIHSSDQ
jgi:hypothetical protein